jgi:hypothetical protein
MVSIANEKKPAARSPRGRRVLAAQQPVARPTAELENRDAARRFLSQGPRVRLLQLSVARARAVSEDFRKTLGRFDMRGYVAAPMRPVLTAIAPRP